LAQTVQGAPLSEMVLVRFPTAAIYFLLTASLLHCNLGRWVGMLACNISFEPLTICSKQKSLTIEPHKLTLDITI
jgi:hypothetical protein